MNTIKNSVDINSWTQEEKEKLAKVRSRIDEVDKKLLELLNDRTNLILQVAEIKKQNTLPLNEKALTVYDPQREKELLDKLYSENFLIKGKLSKVDIEAIWSEILQVSRRMQQSAN